MFKFSDVCRSDVCRFQRLSFRRLSVYRMYVHCPNINMNLRIKAEPITVGADATSQKNNIALARQP